MQKSRFIKFCTLISMLMAWLAINVMGVSGAGELVVLQSNTQG